VRVAGVLDQQGGFQRGIGQFQINDIDLHDHGLAGVKAALEYREAHQFGGRDVEGLEEGVSQRVVGVGEREFDFSQSQHGRLGRACGYQAEAEILKGYGSPAAAFIVQRQERRMTVQAGKKPSTDR